MSTVITEAEKCHDLPSASWRPGEAGRKADGVS